MSGLRNTMKGGWHPEGKEGGKESWRGDFKGINQVAGWMGKGKEGGSSGSGSGKNSESQGGIRGSVSGWMGKGKEGDSSSSGQGSSSQGGIRGQVAGWMGKGNDSNSSRADHVSQPLSALKDPSSFGPPPKHINYHGAAAVPNQTTPDRRGLGAPLSQEQINVQESQRQEVAEAEEAEQKPAPPPVPYRVDTSGLSTNHLPPPPVRRLDSASSASTSSISKSKPPKPPPRLPARNGSPSSDAPPAYSSAPVLSHDYINQDATSRLASAGVSVPGLGIGQEKSSSPAHTPVNELQSRFSRMNTMGSPSAPNPPAQASTNINPQSASNTSSLQQFRDQHAGSIDSGKQKYGDFRERHADTIDSGKQKYGDFRERHADTIDSGKQKYGDFRERHADSIDSGKQKLSGYASRLTGSSPAPSPLARPVSHTSSMNLEPAEPARGTSSVQDFRERHADKIDMGKEKWGGVTSRFNTFVEDRKFSAEANKRIPRPPSRPISTVQSNSASPTEPDIQTQVQRKKAPPPPPKRAEFRASPVDASSPSLPGPPPVPHSTKPR
ncbi:uncharacterized protein N7500_007729 [Penicillium coprophilum]|uniref:uncharacterized protein n=1 Tax=Penicillium coprophilum TaxID=36646 RepID=UPI0023A78AB8|nr:uncharacterized protein N7500_007729 [Penicillium coprophilum]KAJ5158078.1 hypothetical protein N7500_007729 [Penicillium coprophilum]